LRCGAKFLKYQLGTFSALPEVHRAASLKLALPFSD